jgi:hypothetical protein
MSTARAMLERRRASRVRIRIPVKIFSNGPQGQPLDVPGETIGVSRTGALLHLRVPFAPALGTRIEILNGLSQETRECRVIRVSDPQADGPLELGVELLYPGRNFWGIQFPDEAHAN